MLCGCVYGKVYQVTSKLFTTTFLCELEIWWVRVYVEVALEEDGRRLFCVMKMVVDG